MKQMLAFDWELIRQKNYCVFLTILQLIYVLVGISLFHKFVFFGFIVTVILAAVNTYVLMAMVSTHISSNHLSLSNYASCVYFPVKRRHFYYSKAIITGCILCFQCVLTIAVLCLANGIHHRPMSVQFALPYVLGIFMVVSFCSSITTITCFSGRAFQIGTMLCFTFVGMIAGGFSSAYGLSRGELPHISTVGTITTLAICVVAWLIANIIAQMIAKRVSV